MVKVFPQVNEKIVFVGFIQKNDKFEDMEPPKSEYEKLEKHYIITDTDGNVTNVTQNLNYDLGLNSKFFQYSDSIFEQMFNISKICPEILDPDLQDMLEIEGRIFQVDTTDILSNIELESLTAEEANEVRRNIRKRHAYIQLKRLTISSFCKICIYRLIFVTLSKASDEHS